MTPPYNLSSTIISLISSISIKLGEIKANFLEKSSPTLRKQNKIRTIQSTLNIEGNSLSEDQVTALIENKKVLGPQKDIKEVQNAIKVYENVLKLKANSEKSFLMAHKILMDGLTLDAGKYRDWEVGILKGSKVAHVAPPAKKILFLMSELFDYIRRSDDLVLIKSCVFHYEMEFIHPFTDGNGRMGRLWQSVILMKEHQVFEYLSLETLISKNQKKYYKALTESDQEGKSTRFIEFMLKIIDESLDELLNYNNRVLKVTDRLEYFINLHIKEFTRRDYMNTFKNLSSATASRDLAKGISLKLFKKTGIKNQTLYCVI